MLPESGLLAFTVGVRARIALAVAVGLAAAVVGIARYAALGWLIAGVFAGEPLESLTGKFALVGAIMLLRGWLEYSRNMIAHRTAARVSTAQRLEGLEAGEGGAPRTRHLFPERFGRLPTLE